ncbi:hypothetical protein QJS66_08085 [Kocuria rhizophila]|nr:hypothetical protein QJS66_08085 [Kocuria rhizophila]
MNPVSLSGDLAEERCSRSSTARCTAVEGIGEHYTPCASLRARGGAARSRSLRPPARAVMRSRGRGWLRVGSVATTARYAAPLPAGRGAEQDVERPPPGAQRPGRSSTPKFAESGQVLLLRPHAGGRRCPSCPPVGLSGDRRQRSRAPAGPRGDQELADRRASARPSLGQNFMIDPTPSAASWPPRTSRRRSTSWRWGRAGSLTLGLLAASSAVTGGGDRPPLARRLPETVARFPDAAPRLSVVQADAARVRELPAAPAHGAASANLPCSVAVPVLLHILETSRASGTGS